MLNPEDSKILEYSLAFSNTSDNIQHVIIAKGFESMHHAEMWMHYNAAVMSAQSKKFWYAACIHIPSRGDFSCLAVPSYYNEGVEILQVKS